MRLPTLLLLMMSSAVFVRGENNSEFPQTQGQSNQDFSGRASDFANGYSQQNTDAQARPVPTPDPDVGPGPRGKSKVARKSQSGNGETQSGDEARAEDRGGGQDGDGQGDGGNEGGRPVDLDSARANFAAVVEAYVAKRSPKGYWNYVEMKGRKARRLSSPSVDEESVRRLKGELFSGRVKLRDAGGPKPYILQFDVDFSGVNWKVAAVKGGGAAGQ